MDLNGLQSDTQHGYKKNHGTETLLVHFIDSLLVAVQSLDKGLGVVVVLIDLSTAFDTVNHDVRGSALNGLGLSSLTDLSVSQLAKICLLRFI